MHKPVLTLHKIHVHFNVKSAKLQSILLHCNKQIIYHSFVKPKHQITAEPYRNLLRILKDQVFIQECFEWEQYQSPEIVGTLRLTLRCLRSRSEGVIC